MADYQEGQTATNPKTGQKVVFKNGLWVNAGGAAPIGVSSPKVSAQAAKRYNEVQGVGDGARDQFGNLVRAYGLTQSAPTGYLQSIWQNARRMIGAGDGTVQDREQMQALQDQMVMGLRQPGAGSISDAERASFRGSLFSPSYQPEANRGIIDAQIKNNLTNVARARLASQWKAKHGSIDATDAAGRTYDDAVNDFLSSPAGMAALRPFSQRVDEKKRARIAGGPISANTGFRVRR